VVLGKLPQPTIWDSSIKPQIVGINLPGRLLDTRDVSLERLLAEANAAKIKVAHVAVYATALETAPHYSAFEFGLFVCPRNH
jgi:hypothetical protein